MVQAYRGCLKIPPNGHNTNAVHSARYESLKADDHPGCCPPDEVIAIGHRIVLTELPSYFNRMGLMIGRIEEEGEGNLKDFSDFERVRHELEGWRNETNDRSDLKACSCPIQGKAAEQFDVPAMEADLLFRLPQGRIDGGSILLLDTASGKTDLPGMMMKMIRTTSQQYSGLRIAQDDGKQYRSRRERTGWHALLHRRLGRKA